MKLKPEAEASLVARISIDSIYVTESGGSYTVNAKIMVDGRWSAYVPLCRTPDKKVVTDFITGKLRYGDLDDELPF